MRVGPYVIEKTLTKKTHTIVHLARDTRTSGLVAVKMSSTRSAALCNEYSLLLDLDNDAILKPIELIPLDNGQSALILPYAGGGDLFSAVIHGPLSEKVAQSVFFRLAGALRDLHGQSIWHRDVKLENVLLMSTDFMDHRAVKLSDFGLAKRFASGTCEDEWVGSPRYAAPELLKREPYTQMVDIWALGVTLFAALTQNFPYDPNNQSKEVLEGLPFMFCTTGTQWMTFLAKDLLRKMLALDPAARLSADEIMAHRWFDQVRGDDQMLDGR
jgi:serine/threonine protein kinase